MQSLLKWCNWTIEYSFYSLFFFVPLILFSSTSELFELNKMWFTWGVAIIIGASWLAKMIIEKKFIFRRTPLDIPILLFLLSQLISTIFSLDSRVSLWGYYSRFNGGFLSLFSYALLYFAYVTTITKKQTYRMLSVSLWSGLLVALWGLPAHFGKDPTCLIFRGTLDVACWTDAFQPTVRIFSTLGQPAWMAAYLAALLPVSVAYILNYFVTKTKTNENVKSKIPQTQFTKKNFFALCAFLLALLFYVDLIFANTRAGFLAFWAGNVLFWLLLFSKQLLPLKKLIHYFLIINFSFLLLNFFFGIPVYQLTRFTLPEISKKIQAPSQTPIPPAKTIQQAETAKNDPSPSGNYGITDSGTIRLLVWHGALDAWRANPLFGTGVETFAYAYYKYRPAEHNLTSEWDYLYNKAHNEYLNYLTTTGIVGLGTYLLFLGFFVFQFFAYLFHFSIASLLNRNKDTVKPWSITPSDALLTIGLFTGWLTILISNFFGFSVVIMNLYLFLIPAFFFLLTYTQETNQEVVAKKAKYTPGLSGAQWSTLTVVVLVSGYMLLALVRYWFADQAYALGFNLDHANEYVQANAKLQEAVSLRPSEPVFKDELSINAGTLAAAYLQQKDTTHASELAQQAISLSDEVVTSHPNNIIFWKTRVRLFYTLGQVDNKYLVNALDATEHAALLAPTDAKIWYNLGVLYGQNGQTEKGIQVLNKTIQMKKDYRDAYFALALFYHDSADKEKDPTKKKELAQKAIDTLHYSLENVTANDEQAKKTLKSWGVQ